ncbi:hypothetical protein JAAARDRAFT_138288, partial [Jaapia argillacea MUCL 33604]
MPVISSDVINNGCDFPPTPLEDKQLRQIAMQFCENLQPDKYEERGCKVCSKLTIATQLKLDASLNIDWNILVRNGEGITRKERKSDTDSIEELNGPIFASQCNEVCNDCENDLKLGKLPKLSLANGLWIGDIPNELKNLSWAEKLLISRASTNHCITRVSMGCGGYKMKANAIIFANPSAKIYKHLPPPKKDIEEILAIIFTGPHKPTKDDLRRIPLLVRRNKVINALEWLKLNHTDYADLQISHENMRQYSDDQLPVPIQYKTLENNVDSESTSIHDLEEEEGFDQGDCPFAVHGVSGEEYAGMSVNALKTTGLQHLQNNGSVLAIARDNEMQSIYNNPQLYPQMFPWLFPYGLGGLRNPCILKNLSELKQKQHLLMYHDKRFQLELQYPLLALHHEQIKQCTNAGFLTASKHTFAKTAEHLANLDPDVLQNLATRLKNGEKVIPQT